MDAASEGSRIVVLTFSAFYIPGFKAGGALRTLLNLIDSLGSKGARALGIAYGENNGPKQETRELLLDSLPRRTSN